VQLRNFATGTTSVAAIYTRDLIKLKVILPSLKEQLSISDAISDIDSLISSIEKLIDKKKNIKQGAMHELLTGNKRIDGFSGEWKERETDSIYNVDNIPEGYKKTDIGVIPKDWECIELGKLISSMQLGGNYKNSEEITSYPLIKMGNLGRGKIQLSKVEYVTDNIPSDCDKLMYGDLLFNTRNTLDLVGKTSIWRNELPLAYFNSNVLRFKFNENYVSSTFFMNYILNDKKSVVQLRNFATGTTSVAAIYTKDLIKLKVHLPSLDEQKAIAQIISDMDTEIEKLTAKLDKYKDIKQGMMQELLTGKRRLI